MAPRKLDTHQPEVGKLGQQLKREALGLVPLQGVRRHLGFGELANGLTEETLLVGGPQVHRMRATLPHGPYQLDCT